MRDADRIREQSPQSQTWGTVIMTLAAVVGICGVFAMGYTIGRRVERLVPCQVPPAQATRQVTDRLDLERQNHNELTFYDALMGESTAPTPAKVGPKAAPKPAAAGAASSARVASKSPPSPKPAPPAPKVQQVAQGQGPAAAGAQASKAADAARGTYTLQVSSVRRRDEAQALATAMTRQGLQAYITAATIPAKGTWYRVRVGHYDSVQAANVAKANLAQSDIPAWVLRID